MSARRGESRPPWTLSTGAFVSARGLALASAAESAVRRLGTSGDAEALHDLRVALRRLRSCLRAHRGQVHVPRGVERRLRALMRGTNEARDLEALQERLSAWRPGLTPVERAASRVFVARWALSVEERDRLVSAWRRDWRALRPRLRAALTAAAPTAQGRYGPVLTALVMDGSHALQAADAQARSPADLHAVRIGVKRLRYLLEPCATHHPAVLDALTLLRGVQDLLGEYQDCVVMVTQLEQGAAEAAVRQVRAALESGPLGGEARLLAACTSLAPVVARQRAAAWRRRQVDCSRPIAALPATLAPFLAVVRASDHAGERA